jgi:iron complex transport system substrate-binding protein
MPPLRIVSLLPSATELVCALGAEEELVGVSHECDYPPSVRERTVLTRSRLDGASTSAAIDRELRSLVESALSVYSVDEAGLVAAAPDVIITQDLCKVCAVSLDDVRSAVARLSNRDGVRIVSLSPTRLADVLADVERVGAALGRELEGRALRAELESRLARIRERALSVGRRPRVLSVEWLEPLMLGGTWMPELIELAGGTPVGARAGEPAPTIEPAALAELRPDVLLIKPCGFALERTLVERDALERQLRPHLPPATRVYLADGNAYFNRPGPRLVESAEILAACVHPSDFTDWVQQHSGVAYVQAW